MVNLSTLLGHDNNPAFLDGHGLIDADTAPEFWSDTDLGAVWVQVFSFSFYAYLSGVIA